MAENVNGEPTHNEFRVVVGMDLETSGECALSEALQLGRVGREVHLHLVHVIPGPAGNSRDEDALSDLDNRLSDAPGRFRRYLTELSDRLPRGPARSVRLHVRVGDVAREVHQVAVDISADLIVVGTNNRRGIARLMLGNTAQELLAIAHCPVLVARTKDFSSDKRSDQPEPACPDCIKTRARTNGDTLWCEYHARPRTQPHAVSTSEVFSVSSHGTGIQDGGL